MCFDGCENCLLFSKKIKSDMLFLNGTGGGVGVGFSKDFGGSTLGDSRWNFFASDCESPGCDLRILN